MPATVAVDGAPLMLAAAGALGLALVLRVVPLRLGRAGLGVDHWYWKAYVEAYRRQRVFPPALPQFVLDEQQWYPPAFPLLLAHLPAVLFERYSRLLAVGIDVLRLGLLLGVAAAFGGGDPLVVAIAGAVYALSPILVSYNVQLNPRGLGALLLDAAVVLVLWATALGGPPWAWPAAALLAGLVLLTHKMTTQLLWFLGLAASLVALDWRFVALLSGSALVALALSRGCYAKVALAHWDIVSFWHRNWRWLQAHQLLESPVYGRPGYETPSKMHSPGLAGAVRHVRYLAAYLPAGWALAALLLAGQLTARDGATPALVAWAALALAFALATTFVPALKCLGSGYYYLYNAAFPVALLWGLAAGGASSGWAAWSGLALGLGTSLVAVAAFYRKLGREKIGDSSLDDALAYLQAQPRGVVFCLPLQLSDLVAYVTGQPVLTGGHGYGFRRFEPIFPRLLLPLPEVVRRYEVRYVLAREDYLPPSARAELPSTPAVACGPYLVFQFADQEQ